MPKLITTVFANNGDKAFPAASSTDGTVNLDQGYTPQYEIDLLSGDPTAKAVERNIMNGMFNWLFDNQMFDQSHGIAPWFSTFTGGYPLNALVADNTAGTWQIYRSLIDANSSVPTLATAWERILTQTEMLNRIPFAVGGASGSSNGELASATNLNSVTYSQGVWLVTTDAIAASLVNAPSARQGVLICRNTNKNYNPTLANVGSFFQMYIDADGKQYIRSYAVPSGGSTAVWTVWRTTAFLDSPAFTGAPTAPTAALGTSTTQIATTAFVQNAVSGLAPVASPNFTGDPKVPTPAAGDNDFTIANTAFVTAAIKAATGRLLNRVYITANQNYTPNLSVVSFIKVIAQAAGGAGGGTTATASNQIASGFGGNGGTYGETYLIPASSVGTVACVIGKGGVAQSGGSGLSGGATSFGSFIQCPGGQGGSVGAAGSPGSVGSDNAITGYATGNNIAISIPGRPGTGPFNISLQSNGIKSGRGGDSVLGGGGGSINGTTSPRPGYGFGGGGSGNAAGPGAPNIAGANGSDGIIIIEEYA